MHPLLLIIIISMITIGFIWYITKTDKKENATDIQFRAAAKATTKAPVKAPVPAPVKAPVKAPAPAPVKAPTKAPTKASVTVKTLALTVKAPVPTIKTRDIIILFDKCISKNYYTQKQNNNRKNKNRLLL
jgi:hypothetical protein